MVNSAFIPSKLIHSWAASAEAALNALLPSPHITLGHLEELLEAQARTLMLPIHPECGGAKTRRPTALPMPRLPATIAGRSPAATPHPQKRL